MIWMLSILSAITFFAPENDIGLAEARQLFVKASGSEKDCRRLMELEPGNGPQRYTLTGYKAAGTMMIANYLGNPVSKLSNFRKGRKMLEDAIRSSNNDIELKFIRYTIQTNIPGFLGYSSNIQSDKNLLLKEFKAIKDAQLAGMIRDYMLQKGRLNENEQKLITSTDK